jgi:hypothetical protein
MVNQRGLVQRIERKLEDRVGDAFARMFGGAIVPQEVEALLRREAHDGVQTLPGERFLAPNDYVISLGASDFQKVNADRELTAEAFAKHLAGYIQEQGWQTYGEVVLRFEQSDGLHTGQYRARAVVNPDADARSPGGPPAPAEPNHAYTAEPGVPAMTDNPNRGGQSQGRPGDEYYGEQYGRPQEDPGAAAGQQHPPYPPEQGYAPSYEQGYPPRYGYPEPGGYPEQGYEQRPPAPGYGAPGYDQGYRPAPPGYGPPGYGTPGYGGQPQYGPPPGGAYPPPPPPADYDYGRPPAGDPGYGRYEPRPAYPEQPGYQPQGYAAPYGRPQYGQPEYGQPEYGQPQYGQPQYAQPEQVGGYPAPASAPGPDYGQPAQDGYGSYAPPAGPDEYPVASAAVTLQLDDGSGRTYQLREGANVIGRGQDAQFRLPDTGVSRRHVEVRWDGQAALLSDLNSTNGTTVNNAPVQEWQLADGDVIRVGHSEIIVRVH